MVRRRSVEELAAVCSRLKSATAQLVAEVSSLDQQLEETGADIELWLECALVHDRALAPSDTALWHAWDLGYAQLRGRWRLAVRRIQCTVDEGLEVDHVVPLAEPFPLIDAPAEVLREAAPRLNQLLYSLRELADGRITMIAFALRRLNEG